MDEFPKFECTVLTKYTTVQMSVPQAQARPLGLVLEDDDPGLPAITDQNELLCTSPTVITDLEFCEDAEFVQVRGVYFVLKAQLPEVWIVRLPDEERDACFFAREHAISHIKAVYGEDYDPDIFEIFRVDVMNAAAETLHNYEIGITREGQLILSRAVLAPYETAVDCFIEDGVLWVWVDAPTLAAAQAIAYVRHRTLTARGYPWNEGTVEEAAWA